MAYDTQQIPNLPPDLLAKLGIMPDTPVQNSNGVNPLSTLSPLTPPQPYSLGPGPAPASLEGMQQPGISPETQLAGQPGPDVADAALKGYGGGPHMLDKIHGWLSHTFQPNAPAGYEGLLSPDEIKAAQPSLMQSIAAGGAEKAEDLYRKNLANTINVHGAAAQLAIAKRYQAVNNYIAQKYPASGPNDTQEATKQRLLSMYTDMVRLGGDPELIKNLGEAAKGLVVPRPLPDLSPLELGGTVRIYDKHTGQMLKDTEGNPIEFPKTATEDEKNQFIERMSATEAQRKVAQNDAIERMAQTRAQSFKNDKDIAPEITNAAKYANVKVALAQARAGNQAALEPAFINYAGAVDPAGTRLQGNVINMIKDVDPSVKGKAELAFARLKSGTLTAKAIDNMEKLVDAENEQHATNYEQRRAGYIKQQGVTFGPVLDQLLPKTDDVFHPTINKANPALNPTGAAKVESRIKP